MDSLRTETHRDSSSSDTDLSALAWVNEELRRSLEAAQKSLRRYLKEAESVADSDVDAVDPAVLRSARLQIHQGVGALELVGLPAAAQVLRASESAVQRAVGRPQMLTAAAVETIERASFALLDYLGRLLGGKNVSSLSMFPQYRAVQELAGEDRVHPSDLWAHEWRWLELPAEAGVAPRQPDADAHRALEQQLLAMMRSAPSGAAARMSALCAGLGAGAEPMQTATLWKLAAAVFEAQAQGLLLPDVFSKRVASRLLAQFRMLEQGEGEVSERLAQDLLFFCAQSASPGDGRGAPRLAAVRLAYGLARHVPADYNVSALGRFDPAWIAQARKRVAIAKDAWAAIAGGELHRLANLSEQFALVGDSLKRLYPSGEVLADELQATVVQTQQAGMPPQPALAMEAATGLLYLDASLEDADFDNPNQGERVRRLAERIGAVREGRPPEPLEAWMEELYRRVSDRQTLGSVVQELRASLSESEKLIDQFFRNPAEQHVLIPVPGQLSAMRGVLSVLGMDQASLAVLRMRDEVEQLVTTEVNPEQASRAGTFDRLAGNLGALGFLIDMLSVQPQLARSLFAFDAEAGTLSTVMGRPVPHVSYGDLIAPAVEPRLVEQVQTLAFSAAREDVPLAEVTRDLERLSQEAQVADQPALVAMVSSAQAALDAAPDAAGLSAAREQLSEALVDFVASTSEPAGLAPLGAAREPGVSPLLTIDLSDDQEMREIFLEEAREVLAAAQLGVGELAHAPDDLGQLTTVRRAFHTLKGSSRMVGLGDFGEAAWVCEQLYNTRLADQRAADPALLDFTSRALGELQAWVDSIASGQPVAKYDATGLKAAAAAVDAPAKAIVAGAPPPPLLPPDLPSAEDLDFTLDLSPQPTAAAPMPAETAGELDFDFDFGEQDDTLSDSKFSELHPIDLGSQALLEPFELEPAAAQPPAPQSTWDDAAVDATDSELIELDLLAPQGEPEPIPQPEVSDFGSFDELAEAAQSAYAEEEQVKQVGPLRIGIPLFNIYLNEADELSRRLGIELAEWALELHRPVGEAAVALAHSLAGSSSTVGFADLSQLARSLEHALMRSQAFGRGSAEEAAMFNRVADEIRRLLHQFAAGFLKSPPPELQQQLTEHEADVARRMQARSDAETEAEADAQAAPATVHHDAAASAAFGAPAAEAEDSRLGALGQAEIKPLAELADEAPRAMPARGDAPDGEDDIDAIDAVDAELFPIFEEEGQDLLPQLAAKLRDWARRPLDSAAPAGAMRTLHTLKGGARLAGAMRLGEMCHRLEARIEHLLAAPPVQAAGVEALQVRADALMAVFEALRSRDAEAYADATAAAERAVAAVEAAPIVSHAPPDVPAPPPKAAPASPAPPVAPAQIVAPAPDLPDIDWSRFALASAAAAAGDRPTSVAAQSAVRVRAPLLDRMVNQAGEVSITRTRIEADVGQIKSSLVDLTDNLERLRGQLRDLELQAEMQMSSRLEAAKAAAQSFDPLEFDRFTRFQELTRMMAESVNDVATVQRTLQRAVETTEDELVAQARLTRDLQDDLLRTRMVEFEGQADRLYRVVRQAAKETGKQVRLDIVGGSIELDRGVLDRMTAAFEHLLRNCVTHGIETPAARVAAGKDAAGAIIVALNHEGNEVAVEFRDDGGGLDLAAIRAKGVALGLIDANAQHTDATLANLIFTPGFSTADTISELAGRGVGLDVVRSDVNAMGGRIETATSAGKGTSFKLLLPLTTAVTQVVMLRSGAVTVAVPSTLVEVVRRATPAEIDAAYASGSYALGERSLPFFWLGALLQTSPRTLEEGRTRFVVVVRSAQQRIAVHVDDVLGNQEAVVKNLGPQLSRLPGLTGMTLLASGAVALIYNPVALATMFGDAAQAMTRAALAAPAQAAPVIGEPATAAPLILVVDDSLTVRRVTQRLLVREGYRVVLAKDGLDALERLAEETPQLVLSDIEMPRMDGFDLVRNIRGDARLHALPVIMITSRIAQKHRDYAAELGVDHYLGKPYSEEDLLALIGRYTGVEASV